MFIEKIKTSNSTLPDAKFYLGMSTVHLDDQLFISGGKDGGALIDSFTSINTVSHDRSVLPNLPFGVSGHSTCVFQDCVYLFGGLRSDHSSDVLRFSFESDSWERLDVNTHSEVYASFTYNDMVYVFDRDSIKTLTTEHALESVNVYRYKQRGKFVASNAPVVHFDHLTFDVSEGVKEYASSMTPDVHTTLLYVDKVIKMPVTMKNASPYKMYDDKFFYSENATAGKYVHVLHDHVIYSFNTNNHTWFKSYPLSEKTYAETAQSLTIIDDAVYFNCDKGVVEFAHYEEGLLKFQVLDTHTLSIKTVKSIKVDVKSYSARPFFNMNDARIARIGNEVFAYGGMGLHHDNAKLNEYLYNLTTSMPIAVDIDARFGHTMDAYNGGLVVVGGRNEGVYGDVFKINPYDGSVKALSGLPMGGLYNHVSAIVGDKLYIAGGKGTAHVNNKNVFIYNLMTNEHKVVEVAVENVFAIVPYGTKTHILSHSDSYIEITTIADDGFSDTTTVLTQMDEIKKAYACKEDRNNILLILTGIQNGDSVSTVYRLGMK